MLYSLAQQPVSRDGLIANLGECCAELPDIDRLITGCNDVVVGDGQELGLNLGE
jgi:hypothetical protein